MSCHGTTLSPLQCDLLLLPGPNSASSKEEPLSPRATPPRKWIFSHSEPCGRAELRLPVIRCPEELLPLPGSPSHSFALRETHMAMSRDRSVSISQTDHSRWLPVLRCRRWSTTTSRQTTTSSTTLITAGISKSMLRDSGIPTTFSTALRLIIDAILPKTRAPRSACPPRATSTTTDRAVTTASTAARRPGLRVRRSLFEARG